MASSSVSQSQSQSQSVSRSFGFLNPSETAFFVCDVQEKFRSVSLNESIIHMCKRMIEGAKILNIPFLVTEQNSKALGSTIAELDISGCVGKYEKSTFSMLNDEVINCLNTKLQHIRTIVLFGIEAHVCVLQTALELRNRGYLVHIVIDASNSSSPLHRSVAFQRMIQAGVFIESSESVLFQLTKSHSNPKFKQISGLVKVKPATPEIISPL